MNIPTKDGNSIEVPFVDQYLKFPRTNRPRPFITVMNENRTISFLDLEIIEWRILDLETLPTPLKNDLTNLPIDINNAGFLWCELPENCIVLGVHEAELAQYHEGDKAYYLRYSKDAYLSKFEVFLASYYSQILHPEYKIESSFYRKKGTFFVAEIHLYDA